jgi:hypothetical protein
MADSAGLEFRRLGGFDGGQLLTLRWRTELWIELDVAVGTGVYTGSVANGMKSASTSY